MKDTSPLLLDLKVNSLLYAGVVTAIVGGCYHYPEVFAQKAEQTAVQVVANRKTEWACAAIAAGHPLLVDEGGSAIALKDGSPYYGAGKLGSAMLPIPAGTILRDAIGNAGQMMTTVDGQTVFRYQGSCPSQAGKPGVTTMGTQFK